MNILGKYEKNGGSNFYLSEFSENTTFIYNSIENEPVEGAMTSNLKHKKGYYSQTHNRIFLIFAVNVKLLSLNMIV